MSFDLILQRFLDQKQYRKLNVITIGDQWTDHCSIEMTVTFQKHKRAISHHQIKFYPAVDARYLAVELKYITDLFIVDQNRTALLQFANNDADGIIMEFDGYHECTQSESVVDGQSDSESSSTSKAIC